MSPAPLNLATGALARIERLARRARLSLLRRSLPPTHIDRPISASEWNSLYSTSPPPVTCLHSPVARALEHLSRAGDLMLEAGCGSAVISAELAVAGRRIELADFSQGVLDRALSLFERSNLPLPITILADLTKPLPWKDAAVDITWSSGVLEHWTDDELVPIVREMARVSRRGVISLVPYEGCVLYRWGKWVAETTGAWPYGRETPRRTLRHVFENAGLRRLTETRIWPDQALGFLNFVDPEIRREAAQWWESLPPDDLLRETEGYLLLTTGEVG